MKNIGGLMAFLGVFAIVLDFMGRVPTLLMWIYNWGDGVAWGIKIALVVIGGLLFFLGSAGEGEDQAPE